MDDYEKDFYRRKDKVNEFEKDLKAVFEKHKVKLKNEWEMWHGGSKEIIEVHVDGEPLPTRVLDRAKNVSEMLLDGFA